MIASDSDENQGVSQISLLQTLRILLAYRSQWVVGRRIQIEAQREKSAVILFLTVSLL